MEGEEQSRLLSTNNIGEEKCYQGDIDTVAQGESEKIGRRVFVTGTCTCTLGSKTGQVMEILS
jgi:hypothetical protein